MRYNYYQFITNPELGFKIKSTTTHGHSFWTLSGATVQSDRAYTFTTDKVDPLFEGYLRDGEYQIIPVLNGEFDVHCWMDMICSVQDSEDPAYWVAAGTMLWDISEACSSYTNIEEVKVVIENLKDELALLAMSSHDDAEFIVSSASHIWNKYREPKLRD